MPASYMRGIKKVISYSNKTGIGIVRGSDGKITTLVNTSIQAKKPIPGRSARIREGGGIKDFLK